MWNNIDEIKPTEIGKYAAITKTNLGNTNVIKVNWNGKTFEGFSNQKITHWSKISEFI